MLLFFVSFALLWLAEWVGAISRNSRWRLSEVDRDDFGVILTASLTLLGLIIGFSFSMTIDRYDQRKNYEEAEANAIGTEYVRADLLPEASGQKVKMLLKSYAQQRLLFYRVNDSRRLREIDATTLQLQAALWDATRDVANEKPTPITALIVSGMNDVLNSQGYTQAAWWNRIPFAAWVLLGAIAICCNILVGAYRRGESQAKRFLILPLIVAISFLLIADIDSPRGGLIRVTPQNLQSLAQSLGSQR